MPDQRPVVFISYSHDSDEHSQRVRGLAASLYRDGCDIRLDVHKQTGEDWPTWMTRQLLEADVVLCVATETYDRRFRDQELPEKGQGVGWEAGLIQRMLYAKKLHNDRVFPVVFQSTDQQHIPIELQGYDHFDLQPDSGYEPLLRKIHGRPLHAMPAPGEQPELPTQIAKPLFPRPGREEPSGPPAEAALPQRIATSRLLELGVAERFDELVGREEERALLARAWDDPGVRVLVFVAWGGVGKTSLVADWLMDRVSAGWEGVDAFFDWSFYSQGTRDQAEANSGVFFDAALRHFGETDLADSPAPAEQKADQLAECVAAARTLLLLDGVEPLQHPRTKAGLEGRFKDTALARLLRRLAQMPGKGGLCVVTTRVPVKDLQRFLGRTVQQHTLDHLSQQAAAQLLHQAGACWAGEAEIAPDDKELLDAARELDGHALTIQLLGGYLKKAHHGDIRQRDKVDWKKALDQQQEGHAWSVMQAYERWLEQHGDKGQQVLAALRLMGFFDRPASKGCLDVLRSGEVIAGLTEPLADLIEEDWNAALAELANEHRLVSLIRVDGRMAQVDSHPLVREYFAHQLQEERPVAWIGGHKRLYDHLYQTTEQRPDTLEGLQPLYQAVAHGCQAGLHQQACDDVYFDRILRGAGPGGYYSSKKLGAVGADLGAVACFFDHPWSKLSKNLSPGDQAWLLNEAALSLRALGRLMEAREPMNASLEMAIEQEDWKGASRRAGNLSELDLTLGEVSEAIAHAGQPVKYADRSEEALEQAIFRTVHADALH